jgi:ABC-type glycerol-3-phosphate transport system permease component
MRRSRLQVLLAYLVVVLAVVLALFPSFWSAIISVSGDDRGGGAFDIATWSLDNYRVIFGQTGFWSSLWHSTATSIGTTVVSTLLAIPAAYGLTRFRRPLPTLSLAILGVRMMPGIVLVLPFYILFRQVHLLDTMFGLGLTYLTFTLPFAVWMISSFFEAIPRDIEEAAFLDGANRWIVLWHMLVPIAAPAILTTSVLNFLFCWNEFLFALILTSQNALTFLPSLLRYVLPQGPLYGQIFAGSTIFLLPPLFALFLIRRHLSTGFGMGAVR